MKIGITLPQFREDVEPAIAAAKEAERAGLDGVFVFDHLWPIGRPDRPAISGQVLLGGLAGETTTIQIGSLVSRVGVLPDAVLVHALQTLHRMIGGRLIAGLGTGDSLSREENLAFGLPFPPAAERIEHLRVCCRALTSLGITTWAGGTSAAMRAAAHAERVALNLWGVAADVVAAAVAEGLEVTWAGQVDAGVDDVEGLLGTIAAAGASWAVLAPINTGWDEAIARIAAAPAR